MINGIQMNKMCDKNVQSHSHKGYNNYNLIKNMAKHGCINNR